MLKDPFWRSPLFYSETFENQHLQVQDHGLVPEKGRLSSPASSGPNGEVQVSQSLLYKREKKIHL